MYSLVRKLAICLGVIAAFTLYARTQFYRDPGSAFFDQARANEQRYSIFRRAEAQQVIEDHGAQHNGSNSGKAGHAPTLAVGVISVRREHTSYLEVSDPVVLGLRKANLFPDHSRKPPPRIDRGRKGRSMAQHFHS